MSKTFCALPWIHLATHPHGDISLCCESDHTNRNSAAHNFVNGERQFLNLHDNSISDMINSDYFKQVRLQMLAGEQPAACTKCYEKESLGVESKRQYENKNYKEFDYDTALSLTDNFGTIKPNLKFVELRLGNTCNLACRTCNPVSSSKWRTEYKSLEQNLKFVQNYGDVTEFKWPEKSEFWDELFDVSDNMVSLYINGGEPMLIKKHWGFLEDLIASGKAKNIHLWYSTNMTIINDRAWGIWKEFGRVRILASIDDLGDRNRYIRYSTEWNKVEKFIELLKENQIEWMVIQTISAMNFFYLDEFNVWVENNGTYVGHNFVSSPDFLGPMAIPLNKRLEILDKLKDSLPQHLYDNIGKLYGHTDRPDLWEKFNTYTKELDLMRNEKFSDTFPEFEAFMNRN